MTKDEITEQFEEVHDLYEKKYAHSTHGVLAGNDDVLEILESRGLEDPSRSKKLMDAVEDFGAQRVYEAFSDDYFTAETPYDLSNDDDMNFLFSVLDDLRNENEESH